MLHNRPVVCMSTPACRSHCFRFLSPQNVPEPSRSILPHISSTIDKILLSHTRCYSFLVFFSTVAVSSFIRKHCLVSAALVFGSIFPSTIRQTLRTAGATHSFDSNNRRTSTNGDASHVGPSRVTFFSI